MLIFLTIAMDSWVYVYISKYAIEYFKYVFFIVCPLHLVKLVNIICIITTLKFLLLILTILLDYKFKYPTPCLIAFPVFPKGPLISHV